MLVPTAKVASEAPGPSKVQVYPDPLPKVVVPISVVSSAIDMTPPASEVSMPVAVPMMDRVPPKTVVDDPVSPAKMMEELVSSLLSTEVPKVVVKELPDMTRPVPVKSVIVSPPTVTDPKTADPVTRRF